MKKLFLFTICFITYVSGFAQMLNVSTSEIASEIDGISDYKLISDDNSSTLWVSSTVGEVYYNTDNSGWEKFQISNIDIEQINAIEVTANGVLYIATQDQGVIYGDGPEMAIYDNSIDLLKVNRYVDVIYDNEGVLWMLDSRGRLFKLKDETWRDFSDEAMGTMDDLEILYLDSFGDVWAFGEDTSDEHIEDDEFVRHYFSFYFGPAAQVNSVFQNEDDVFWLSTRKGPLVKIKGEEDTDDRAAEITENRGTTHILFDNNDLIWFSLRNGGIMIWDDLNKTRETYELTDYPDLPTDVKGMWLNEDNSISLVAADSPNIITIERSPVSIDEIFKSTQVNIFPNPSSEFISIDTDVNFESLEISNANGSISKRMNSSNSSNRYYIGDLHSGLYSIKFLDGNDVIFHSSFIRI